MSPLEKRTLPLIFAIAIIGFIMSIVMSVDDFAHHWVVREDGFLESLTALSLLAAAILCGYRCWSLRHCRSGGFLLCTALWGCALVFGMGEEISWGQRILGIQTPEFFVEHNAQHETNLHNMMVGQTSINKLVFGKLLAVVIMLYLIASVFYGSSPTVHRWLGRLAIPLPRTYQVVAVLALVVLIESSGARKRGEITEFSLCSIGLLVLINPKNRSIFRADPDPDPLDDSLAAAPVVLNFADQRRSPADDAAAEPPRRAVG